MSHRMPRLAILGQLHPPTSCFKMLSVNREGDPTLRRLIRGRHLRTFVPEWLSVKRPHDLPIATNQSPTCLLYRCPKNHHFFFQIFASPVCRYQNANSSRVWVSTSSSHGCINTLAINISWITMEFRQVLEQVVRETM